MAGPLHDVRVLDLGAVGVGPWAATLLALLGADVIKVESPNGDRIRIQPPLQRGLGTTYAVVNLNKRCAIIDLKNRENRPSVERLVRQSAVVMDNLRPAVMERLGLHWEAVKGINPRVVSASASAWGDKGPMRDLPGLDYHMQMMSGYASLNGRPEEPGQILRFPHLDYNTSCFLAASVLLGLLARERTGKGQRVVTTHLGSSIVLLLTRFAEFFATAVTPQPMGSMCGATAPHGAFKCADGRYILVGVENERRYQAFCRALIREDLTSDPRFVNNRLRVQHAAELNAILQQVFLSKPSRWWTLRLEKKCVPCGTIKNFDTLRHHQQILDNRFLLTVMSPSQGPLSMGRPPWDFSKTRVSIGQPPFPGEHTEEILKQGFGRTPTAAPETRPDLKDGERPLTGFRVLDASQGYAGPFASLLLAEAGAEVFKVEPPGGDYARSFAPSCRTGDGAAFAMLNRNKKSVELDLGTPDGRKAYKRLARSADVVIEDWGPGVADGMSIGYRALARDHRELVYCSITAFGEEGPFGQHPIAELIGQGWTEYLQNLGAPGDPPERCGADVVGIGTGIMTFLGILAALYHRLRKPGQGQRLGISSLGTMMFFKSAVWAAMTDPDVWEGDDYCNSEIRGRWHGYQAKDRPIYFNLNNCTEEQYIHLLGELGMLEEAIADSRFGNAGRDSVGLGRYAKEVQVVWEKHFRTKNAAELVNAINLHGGAAVPMLRLDEVFQHPQARVLDLLDRDADGSHYIRAPWRGAWEPVKVIKPPRCGEHTGEVSGPATKFPRTKAHRSAAS